MIDETIPLLPTPKSHPSGPDYARINRPESGSDDLLTRLVKVLNKGND